MHIFVTRPEPGALHLKAKLEALGHSTFVEPLMKLDLEGFEPIDLEGVTALIATSQNALLALQRSPARAQARELTIFTVGAATAREARRVGFGRVIAGPGTAADLVPIIASTLDPADESLLHLAGEELAADLAGDLGALGFQVRSVPVYRMSALARLSESCREQIGDGSIEAVLLMSPRTAAIYAALLKRDRLQGSAKGLIHMCLSQAVARQLQPLGEVPVQIADEPTLEELLALIERCAAQLEG